MTLTFFYIFAGLTVLSALAVISFRNTLSSALALVMSFFGVACLYVLLQAQFLATMQILVYAGAIMVLFLFVVMLMNLGREALLEIKLTFAGVVGVLLGTYLAVILMFRLKHLSQPLAVLPESYGSIRDVGKLLFSNYLVPFELTSFLLLVGVIGAVVLSGHSKKET